MDSIKPSSELTKKQHLKAKLSQESTWRGIITVAALAGVKLTPNDAETIITGAVSIVAMINIFKSD
jgi:hypothetical protein